LSLQKVSNFSAGLPAGGGVSFCGVSVGGVVSVGAVVPPPVGGGVVSVVGVVSVSDGGGDCGVVCGIVSSGGLAGGSELSLPQPAGSAAQTSATATASARRRASCDRSACSR
jgi:hypothetical protein